MRSLAACLLLALAARTEAATLLLVGDNARLKAPGVEALHIEAAERGWRVRRWRPATPIAAALDGGEIVIAGDAGDAGRAVAALAQVALHLQTRSPVVIRLPLDALCNDYGSMARLEDGPRFYAERMLPDWLPQTPGLKADAYARGAFLKSLTDGDVGPLAIDITDSSRLSASLPLRPTAPPPDRPIVSDKIQRAVKQADLPGTPLDSAQAPGLWFGKGDRETGAGWASASQSMGKLQRAHAEGSFTTKADGNGLPFDGTGTVNLDYTDQDGISRGKLDVAMMGENFGGSFRLLNQSAGLDKYTLLRAELTRRDSLGPVRNDASVKGGYLFSQLGLQGGQGTADSEGQLLWGAGDTVSSTLDLRVVKLTAEAGADAVWSRMYGQTQWDNYKLHGGAEAVVPLREDLHLMAQYKHRVLEQNPDKYFFMTSRTDDQGIAALAFQRRGFGAGVLGGVQKVRGEQADDEIKKGGLWLTAWDTTLTCLAGRGDWTQYVTFALSKKVAKDWDVEAYVNRDQMVRYDYKQDTAGVRVAWGFGGGANHGVPDERRYRQTRDDLYAQRFYQDRDLPLDTFEKQTDSIRKVNEWSGKNLSWVTGSDTEFARTPSETYGGRSGDCDEQAWLVSRSLNDNADFRARGGKAYILDYWTPGAGHGVSLVDEGGKVYLNEYGRIYRINVDPNAPVETQAAAALKQEGGRLALPVQNGKPVQYVVFGTKDSGTPMTYFTDPNQASPWMYDPSFQTASNHPQVETGVNSLLGIDSF